MNIDNGTQFVVSYIPETINKEKNTEQKIVFRSALFDDKSKVWTTTKGETVLTYFDLERNGINKINSSRMKVTELDQITGTLSKPSKMPGWAYGIPAKECKVGSKLAKIPGTVCHGCYALKGCYVFPNVQAAQYKRLDSITDPRWVQAMAAQILRHKSKWFRWHDSGDIQSLDHLKKIFAVCILTPDVNHWMPTREAGILAQVTPDQVPANLIIRLSATKVDGSPSSSWQHTSTVVTEGKTCPAAEQDNKCLSCRACWDKSIPNIAYGKH